jgi:peptidoglycan/LPS O-acetylase OafA/YrhL
VEFQDLLPSANSGSSVKRADPAGTGPVTILLVILHHRFPDHGLLRRIGEAGWIGVDLFFVLSGYLITGILLDTVGKR